MGANAICPSTAFDSLFPLFVGLYLHRWWLKSAFSKVIFTTGNICVPLREFLQHQQAVLADFHFFPEALNFDLSAYRLAISIQ
jgi:hypothetical protein